MDKVLFDTRMKLGMDNADPQNLSWCRGQTSTILGRGQKKKKKKKKMDMMMMMMMMRRRRRRMTDLN